MLGPVEGGLSASGLRTFCTRSRYDLRTLCGRSAPVFASLYGLRTFNREHLVRPDTDVCIEGFPRSANSYSVLTFAKAQARPVRIAHHLHVAAQVARAARWNIPAVVLIRRPLDAAASLLIRCPELSPRQVLGGYLAFYRPLLRLRGHFVLARFDEAVRDFGPTVDRVNLRFGTAFGRPIADAETDVAVFRLLDRINATQGTARGEHAVSRPSVERDSRKRPIHDCLERGRAATLLARADSLYERFLAACAVCENVARTEQAAPLRRAA